MGRTATPCYHVCGELLPRLFTLTCVRRTCDPVGARSRRVEVSSAGGSSLLRCPKRRRLPVISRHGALYCPDFPHTRMRERQKGLLREQR